MTMEASKFHMNLMPMWRHHELAIKLFSAWYLFPKIARLVMIAARSTQQQICEIKNHGSCQQPSIRAGGLIAVIAIVELLLVLLTPAPPGKLERSGNLFRVLALVNFYMAANWITHSLLVVSDTI